MSLPEQSAEPLQDSKPQLDSLLRAYVQATTETESQNLAAQLICDYAEPVIAGVLRYKLGVWQSSGVSHPQPEAEDISSEVIVELLTRLQKFKADPAHKAINDFRSLVAVITYQACAKYLRKKNPQRSSLKNRLRYVLTRWPNLALWTDDHDELICGFANWQKQKEALASEQLRRLPEHPQAFKSLAWTAEEMSSSNPADLLTAIFQWAGSPVRFDDLVDLVAELWGVKDQTATFDGDPNREQVALGQLPDPRANVAGEVEKRIYLQHLWSEIRQLSPRQRHALLLNLTDATGYALITLLPIIGIASFRAIADVLELSPEQLAELWNDLPIDDTTIAARLSLTRQQVINLRKAARERLARRMNKESS